MDIFILELDGRQEQEETSALLKSGCIYYTLVGRAGILVQYLANLGIVVFYEDTPPNCNVQSV